MLYTTYLSNMKNIPKNCLPVIIMRMVPASIIRYDYLHISDFSPETETLLQYKKDKDWDIFKEKFLLEIENNKNAQKYIEQLIEALSYIDICLICCEKDYEHCHRTLLLEYLKNKYNIEGQELDV